MTISIAGNDARLTELDEQERDAWATYRDGLRDLDGVEYEEAEGLSWAQLQETLQHLARERDELVAGTGVRDA